ncbi:MAG: NrfD/PsrC family molybdoenzyme membrane anchor subunit [Desulfobacterales bacterium]
MNTNPLHSDGRPATNRADTYYGMSPVKPSYYHLKTALSYYAEALGAGPQLLAAVIELVGEPGDRSLTRIGRYLALGSSLAAPGLLVSELHTPQRWFNMLRIYRPTSPMSIGNMSLTAFGLLSAAAAAGQLVEDLGYAKPGRWVGRILSVPSALAATMVCLYTGAELQETCTPLWASARPLLTPLFGVTAVATGTAGLIMAATIAKTPAGSLRRAEQFSLIVHGLQVVLVKIVESNWRRLPSTRSFRDSRHALTWRYGILGLGTLFPLGLRLQRQWAGRSSTGGSLAASAASLAGGFFVYATTLEAGNQSAAEATDYFESTSPHSPSPRGRLAIVGFSVLAAVGLALFFRRKGDKES